VIFRSTSRDPAFEPPARWHVTKCTRAPHVHAVAIVGVTFRRTALPTSDPAFPTSRHAGIFARLTLPKRIFDTWRCVISVAFDF
jgi:hypothetical protein